MVDSRCFVGLTTKAAFMDPYCFLFEASKRAPRERNFWNMKMRRLILMLLLGVPGVGQEQQPVQDLGILLGKQVIVQRIPLCQPGTFTPVLTYAGKAATVVSLKPKKMQPLSRNVLNRLPQGEMRELLEGKGATILVKFEDGTQLDSCAAITPSRLADYFEVVAGQTLEGAPANPVTNPVTSAVSLPPQECPVSVVKATSTDGGFRHALAESLTKSQFERDLEKARNGGHDAHYLDTRMRNASPKPIKAIEAFVVYSDKMGDQGARQTILSQNDKSVPPRGEYRGYSVDTAERWRNGKGEVTVYVNRVRFEDDTFWQDNGSHSCALTSRIKQ